MKDSTYTMEYVWAAMRRKDFVALRDMVHEYVLTDPASDDRRVFEGLFALDIAVPFVLLLWNLVDDSTPEDLAMLVADCFMFNKPLHRKRSHIVALLNYWLARDNLPLLPEKL